MKKKKNNEKLSFKYNVDVSFYVVWQNKQRFKE